MKVYTHTKIKGVRGRERGTYAVEGVRLTGTQTDCGVHGQPFFSFPCVCTLALRHSCSDERTRGSEGFE